jgi:hypothetical protein
MQGDRTQVDDCGRISCHNPNALGCLVANESQEKPNASTHRACQSLWEQPVIQALPSKLKVGVIRKALKPLPCRTRYRVRDQAVTHHYT